MKKPILLATVCVILLMAAPGCGEAPPSAGQTAGDSPKVEETIPLPTDLPDYAYRSSMAAKAYGVAVVERDLLSKLPCYCGCGQDADEYKNLKDCFFARNDEFRDHGANCQICQEEAIDAARWKAEGLTVSQIRARIEASYEGRGKPTDTPPVDLPQ